MIRAEGATKETQKFAFGALADLSEINIDIIESIATYPLVEKLMKEIGPYDSSEAIELLSQLFVSTEDKIVMWAFQGGLLPRALEILNTGITKDRKHILFGLSNITAGENKEHIANIMEESYLMTRIL